MQQSQASTEDSASTFSDSYRLVAEANRLNYASGSAAYVEHTECVNATDAQQALIDHIKEAIKVRGSLEAPLRALDACGGSGNAAIKMQELGCVTTLADISPELIAIYGKECEKRGFECDAMTGEIGAFLLETDKVFDLILFSSALHHLQDPALVLKLAGDRLAPGGVIATIFDPCPLSRRARMVTEPLRMLRRAVREPKLILTRFGAVTHRIMKKKSMKKVDVESVELTDENIGIYAEFHGQSGVDDFTLIQRIEETTPLRVVQHRRYIGHVTRLARIWLSLLHSPNRFTLILQKQK